MPDATLDDTLARALIAYDELASLGEDVEDEWTYVTDLATAWRDRLEGVAAARGPEPANPATERAIDRAIEEIARIEDPHRAIDWLSTFPQIVLVAVGARP